MTERNYLETMPTELAAYYQAACDEYEKQGVFFLKEEYLVFLQEKYDVFPRILSDLITAAKELSQDKASALYALFVYKLMVDAKFFVKYGQSVWV